MVVLNELAHGPAKMPLTKRYELVQALRLDRQHEALRVRVPIGTACRQLDALDSGNAKAVAEVVREESIPIVNQISRSLEKPVDPIGHVSRDLLIQAPCGR